MLAARIRLGQKLFDTSSTPTFNFTQRSGRIKLNISIDLDPSAVELADDGTGTGDPDENEKFRDAKIGSELLRGANLEAIHFELIDPADDSSTFVVRARIGTKLPGTGSEFEKFKANLFEDVPESVKSY